MESKTWSFIVHASHSNLLPIAAISTQPHVMILCANGILYASSNMAYFVEKEELAAYEIPNPTTFSVPSGISLQSLVNKNTLEYDIILNDAGMTCKLTTNTSVETFKVDQLVSSPTKKFMGISDKLYRLLMYRATAKNQIEIPITFAPKTSSNDLKLTIFANGNVISVSSGDGEEIGRIRSQEHFSIEVNVSKNTVKNALRSTNGDSFILGIVPNLGEFEEMIYLRNCTYGKLIILL